MWISACRATRGLELLREAIAERLELQVQRLWLHLPPGAGALRARLYAAGVVREERTLEDGALELLVELPAAELGSWAAQPGVQLLGRAEPGGLRPLRAVPRIARGAAEPRRVRC